VTQPPDGRLDVVVRRLPLYSLGAFLLVTVLMSALARATDRTLGPTYLDGPAWLDAWFQGDSGWYHGIAELGYSYTPGQQSTIAFFPVYPLLVRVLGEILGGDFSTAAGLVTLVCAAGAVMLFADWVRSRVPPRTAVVAVAVLLFYPYSFFLYGSGYSDASFLLTALGSFALLERRHYVLAGLVGVLATAGRPVGIAVAVGLIVRAAEMIAEDRAARRDTGVLIGSTAGSGFAAGGPPGDPPADRSGPVPFRELLQAVPFMRWRQAALLVSGAGLVAWMVYLGVRFGDPFAFATVQGAPGWDQGAGPRTWFKVAFAGTLVFGIWHNAVLLVPQALACLAAVLLVRTVWRRFGWGYTAYTVVSLAIPIIGTKDFMGSGRYVLAAYPVMAAAAVVLTGDRRPRWLVPVVLAVLLVGLCIATVGYVNGVEVS
jgi:hypothetical protein